MTEFENKIAEIDRTNLKQYLIALKKPCYESDLLKLAFSDHPNLIELDPLTLYQNHFALFHVLYQLQDEFYDENLYLHVHFMRTFLLQYPEKKKCRFYNDNNFSFCNADCTSGLSYCAFHQKQIGIHNIEILSVKYFYLEPKNYFKINKDNAEKFISGTWELLSFYDEYKKSLALFNLTESATPDEIKKKYKELAKKYHPDISNKEDNINDTIQFSQIYDAYKLLLKLTSNLYKL